MRATDFIERECGKTGLESYPNDGHFIQKTYTNEVYTAQGRKQERLVLRNAPVTYLTVTGNLTANRGCANVTSPIYGHRCRNAALRHSRTIPAGNDRPLSPGATSALTMSQPASVSQTGAVFEISGLISFQWRSGTPSNPNWTSFIQDQFELDQQGRSGIIRVYGSIPGLYNNMIRATYVAGFPANLAERRRRRDASASRPISRTSAKISSSAYSNAANSTGKQARTSRVRRRRGETDSTRSTSTSSRTTGA